MLIEFSEFNFKLLLLLINPIFTHLEKQVRYAYSKKDNDVFKAFRYFLSYIFAGVFLIIFKIRNRKLFSKERLSLINDKKKEVLIDIIIEKDKRKRKIINILIMILLCNIGMFCQFFGKLLSIIKDIKMAQSIGIFFHIVFFVVLSYFILHQKLYKHHFISLGIITVVLLISFIISLPFLESIFGSCVYYFFYYLLFAIYDILKKKYMNLYYHTPYFIMFVIGLINSIGLLIYDIIAYYVNPDVSGIIIGFNDNINSIGDAFLLILDLILQCIWNLGIWLVIYYYTPCHIFIPELISQFVFYVTNVMQKNDEFYYLTINIIVFSFVYFINFCCIIIFNEIIILNFFGMDYNTIKRIKQREMNDSKINMIALNRLMNDEEDEDNN